MNPTLGGVQRVSDTIARYLVGRGHKIHYLTFDFDELDNYIFPGRLHKLPGPVFYSETNLDYYHHLLKELEIDVIINNDAANERSRLFLNTGNNKVVKLSVYHTDPLHELYHDIDLSIYIKYGWIVSLLGPLFIKIIKWNRYFKKKRQIKWLVRNSTNLLLISEAHREKIKEVLNITSKDILVIYNPSAYTEALEMTSYKKIVLFVGRIDIPVKRPDRLLEIWSEVEHEFPNWELYFLGDGPGMNDIRELNHSLGLSNTKFLGYIEPEKYYKQASIICLTSEYEGFPSVLIESMHFGVVPVVFNNWSSLSEVVIDNLTGMVADRDRIDQFVIKLRKLMSEEETLRNISENAISHVKKFSIDIIGPQWDALLAGFGDN
jgi:glycosyltransferase involved in cell wall biosynthesis